MYNDNNQEINLESCVGEKNIKLYTSESRIANRNREIMNKHKEQMKNTKNEMNPKEYEKKSVELFHLLTYLDINKKLESTNNIKPNEPGDFIVLENEREVLYEIVTVFGDEEAREIKDKIKEILNEETVQILNINKYPKMDIKKLSVQFKRILCQKKNKDYFKIYEKSILLLVTAEHDRCGTVPWYLHENIEENINEFINVTQSSIMVMNYFRSGKNGNPETYDIEEEIKIYKKYF